MTKRVIVDRDVTFAEDEVWKWDDNEGTQTRVIYIFLKKRRKHPLPQTL